PSWARERFAPSTRPPSASRPVWTRSDNSFPKRYNFTNPVALSGFAVVLARRSGRCASMAAQPQGAAAEEARTAMAQDFDDGAFDNLEMPQTKSYPELLRIIRQRKSLIVLGIVVCLVLGGLYYVQQKPMYRSSAQVMVTKKRPDTMPIPGLDG